jgi:hypothetical protein
MTIFFLEPLELSDPSWQASSLKESCWTEATTEAVARHQVECATFIMVAPAQPESEVVKSPWVQPRLSSRRIDNSQCQLPSGKVLGKTGKIIEIPAG